MPPMPCSLPAALEVMGERWSFLILRGAFNGLCHFEQFQSTLGIARNILATRLGKLVAAEILERQVCAEDRRKIFYRLTEKGEALLPTLIALRQWGEKWEAGRRSNVVLVDRRDHMPVAEIMVTASDGRRLKTIDLAWIEEDNIGRPVPDRALAQS